MNFAEKHFIQNSGVICLPPLPEEIAVGSFQDEECVHSAIVPTDSVRKSYYTNEHYSANPGRVYKSHMFVAKHWCL